MTYFADSRRLRVGILAVTPLLLVYEVGILLADPGVRNGADASFRRLFDLLGPKGEWIWIGLLLSGLVLCALSLYRERIPAVRCAVPIVAEGLLYAVLFGPFVLLLQDRLGPGGLYFREHFGAMSPQPASSVLNLILAVGAGVYEEALFRLLLLSLLYYLGKRLCEFLAVPPWLAVVAAILLSAVAFSSFHHVGEFAAPFSWPAFTFRLLAGVVLGAVFALRGFGVAVYTHAFYDILYLFAV